MNVIDRILQLLGHSIQNARRYRHYLEQLSEATLKNRLADLEADAARHQDRLDYGRPTRLVIKHPIAH